MMKNKTVPTLVVLALLVVVLAQPLSAAQKKNEGLSNFWTLDIYGNEVTQEIFTDYDLTLVNIWATFCSPCLQEMPGLGELHKEYQGKGVNIIGIVTDVYDRNEDVFSRNLETAHLIIEQTGADYTHLLPSLDIVNARPQYGQVVPETFFVDSKGNIVGQTYVGSRSKASWKNVIETTLAQLK